MQELKCPECGHLNPDIRELGYTLPWTCGNCPHIWRLQDVMPTQKPMPLDTPVSNRHTAFTPALQQAPLANSANSGCDARRTPSQTREGNPVKVRGHQ